MVRVSVPQEKVMKAAVALTKFSQKQAEERQENALFDANNETVTVKFQLSEIPARAIHKPIRMKLPNPIYDENSSVCVFVRDDLEDRSKKFHETKRKFWKNLVKNAGIPQVKKVIDLTKLKKEFKSFEQKQELAKSHDLFLCDKSIVEVMPRELGKYISMKLIKH